MHNNNVFAMSNSSPYYLSTFIANGREPYGRILSPVAVKELRKFSVYAFESIR